jgi:hypothetical protein
MTEQKRERGVKVLVKRKIWLEDDVATKVGTVITLTKEQVKHYGSAVTKDLPEGEDD